MKEIIERLDVLIEDVKDRVTDSTSTPEEEERNDTLTQLAEELEEALGNYEAIYPHDRTTV